MNIIKNLKENVINLQLFQKENLQCKEQVKIALKEIQLAKEDPDNYDLHWQNFLNYEILIKNKNIKNLLGQLYNLEIESILYNKEISTETQDILYKLDQYIIEN